MELVLNNYSRFDRRGGVMNPESSPSSEEMGLKDEETRVPNQELAREMADAEISPRNKMEIAVELGLSKESIEGLGLEADQAAEKRRAEYEQAMEKAEELLTELLKSPIGQVDLKINPNTRRREDLDTIEALESRANNYGQNGTQIPKTFKFGSQEKRIALEYTPNHENMVLKFKAVERNGNGEII